MTDNTMTDNTMTDNTHRDRAIKDQIEVLAGAVVSIRERGEVCNISGDSGGSIFDDINSYHATSHFLDSNGVRPYLTSMQKYIISRLRSQYRDATDQFNSCQCRG